MNAPATPRFRWRRAIAKAVIFISGTLVCCYLALATTEGSRWLLRHIAGVVPFEARGIEGNLVQGVSIQRVHLTLEGTSITIENLAVNLDLWPLLLAQEFRIASLSSSTLVIKTTLNENATPSTALPVLPALPIRITIRDIAVPKIIIDERIPLGLTLKKLTLAKQHLTWQQLTFSQAKLQLNSSGEWISDGLQQQLSTKLKWSLEDIRGELIGEGPLNQWAFNHSLSLGESLNQGQVFSSGTLGLLSFEDVSLTLDNQISGLAGNGWRASSPSVRLDTDLKDFSVVGDIDANTDQSGDISGHIQVSGSLASHADLALTLSAIGGEGTLNAMVHWADIPMINGTFAGKNFRLDKLEAWPDHLQAITQIESGFSLTQRDNQLRWQLYHAHLNGMLGDAPLTLRTKAYGDEQQSVIESLFIQHLGNWIEAQATLKERMLSATFSTNINDLRLYHQDIQGDARIKGQWHASLDNWQTDSYFSLNINSREITASGTSLGGLNIEIASQKNRLTGHIYSDFVHSGELALAAFSHSLEGDIGANHVALSGVGGGELVVAGQRFSLPSPTSQWAWYRQGKQLLEVHLQANDQRFELSANAALNRQQRLTAEANVAILALDWLSSFNPHIEQIDGRANLAATASGELKANAPFNINSQFVIDAPTIALIDPAMLLNSTSIRGQLLSDGRYRFEGSAQQGDKPITLTGGGYLFSDNGPTLEANIKADGLRAFTPKIDIAVSPDISLDVTQERVKVRGNITIPRADIEISQLPNASFSRSDDVIVMGREAPPVAETIAQDLNIQLRIDDNVVIKAAGLATKLRGELTYSAISNTPVNIQGKLDLVDGSLSSQSGDLSIKRGSLIFSGSPDNPAVDIIAVRSIDSPTLEVGLHITGTVNDLRTAIVSIPAIDQTRALSFLVFGRDITQENGDNSNSNAQLMSAAVSLGIGQSSSLMQNLKRSTGLDELAAVANDSGSASLIAGKQINSKLYARYRYDMAEALSVLLLRYRLSQRWTLEAESGADNSIDVLYRLGD
jgi:autotransporter translocation and assembly factor TamB